MSLLKSAVNFAFECKIQQASLIRPNATLYPASTLSSVFNVACQTQRPLRVLQENMFSHNSGFGADIRQFKPAIATGPERSLQLYRTALQVSRKTWIPRPITAAWCVIAAPQVDSGRFRSSTYVMSRGKTGRTRDEPGSRTESARVLTNVRMPLAQSQSGASLGGRWLSPR